MNGNIGTEDTVLLLIFLGRPLWRQQAQDLVGLLSGDGTAAPANHTHRDHPPGPGVYKAGVHLQKPSRDAPDRPDDGQEEDHPRRGSGGPEVDEEVARHGSRLPTDSGGEPTGETRPRRVALRG
jgi:hypothetical protein